MKTNKINLLPMALTIVLAIIIVVSTISTSGENRRLKTSIKENNKIIKELENEKIIIFESIEKKSKLIKQKDSIIFELKNKEILLINNLKNLKNERIKIQAAYFNNNVNERVAIFSDLASEVD